MNKLIKLAILVGVFLAVSLADAGQRKFTVLVTVVPAYTTFNEEVESYLKRELRGLSDVTIVEKNGDFFISVVAAPLKQNDQATGIALSYVFQHNDFILHNVDIGQRSNLKNMCERVVALFDSMFLERYRGK
jgi:hypothetical protein